MEFASLLYILYTCRAPRAQQYIPTAAIHNEMNNDAVFWCGVIVIGGAQHESHKSLQPCMYKNVRTELHLYDVNCAHVSGKSIDSLFIFPTSMPRRHVMLLSEQLGMCTVGGGGGSRSENLELIEQTLLMFKLGRWTGRDNRKSDSTLMFASRWVIRI